LFLSLARYAGERTIGIIMSGMLRDGTRGLSAIKKAGGRVLVQMPADASHRGMPSNAIEHVAQVDEIGTAEVLAGAVCRLTGSKLQERATDACP
jgi:two-component system, chemotaxis family, protein-glutamate methylesterase/glutaminase